MKTALSARPRWILAMLGGLLLFPITAITPGRAAQSPVTRVSNAADGLWSGIQPLPQARARHVGVYDSNLHRMIVFGGRCMETCCSDGPVPADTWSYPVDPPSSSWYEIRPGSVTPPTNLGPVGIYDPVRGRLLVLALPDVWSLGPANAPVWSTLATTGTPPGISIRAAVYDPGNDRMVAMASNGRVWELTLSGTPAWTELSPTGILPSNLASAIYDSSRDRVVAFADSVRALTLSGPPEWSAVAENLATPGHTSIYDAGNDRAIIHGGSLGGEIGTSDTWELTFSGTPTWTKLSTSGPLVSYHSAVYDPVQHRMLVFGGYAYQFYVEWMPRELWALSLDGAPVWTNLTAQLPPVACDAPAVLDPVHHRMIVVDDAVRTLDLSGPPDWTTLPAGGPAPPERTGYAAIYDPPRQRLLMFGGTSTGGTNLQDLWQLTLGGSPQWTQLSPTGTPPDTAKPAVYDPVRDVMLVVGGEHVWRLSSLGGTPAWNEMSPSGTPPGAVYDQSVALDPVHDRVIVFGGVSGTGLRNNTWRLTLSPLNWNALGPLGTPPDPREGAMMVYDSARQRMVLSGGDTGVAAPAGDTHELDLSTVTWNTLDPDVIAQGGWTAIYDPVADRMVSVGQCATAASPACEDPSPGAWSLWFNAVLDAPRAPAAGTLSLAQSLPNPAPGNLTIRFSIARPGPATLRVYDISGRVVRTLVSGDVSAGAHVARWDRTRDDGGAVEPGVYFYELRVGGERLTRRMILLQ